MKKDALLVRLLAGKVSVGKVFWIWWLAGTTTVYFLTLLAAVIHIGGEPMRAIPSATNYALMVTVPYLIFVSTCLWRSASNADPASGFRRIAKLIAVMPAIVLIIGVVSSIQVGTKQGIEAERISTPPQRQEPERSLTSQPSSFRMEGAEPTRRIDTSKPAQANPLDAIFPSDTALASIRSRYPFFDPYHPDFNQAVNTQMYRMGRELMRRGYLRDEAYLLAADLVGNERESISP